MVGSSAQTLHRLRWLLLIVVLSAATVVLFWPSGEPEAIATLAGETMGTTWTVRLAGAPDTARRDEARVAVEAALARVDDSMSTWKEDSELSRFNRHAPDTPFPISRDLLTVLQVSRGISEQSGGAFDVTVGPLVDAWGFGPGGRDRPFAPPDEATLTAARALTGYRKLRIDGLATEISKATAGLRVDLSAVAKGYGVDQAAAALEALGERDFVVEVGGEVVARGRRGDGPWRVGVEYPSDEPSRRVYATLQLSDAAMATSGSYHNFRAHEGKTYAHTIDPRSGRPVEHSLVSATVVTDSCARADAWATALTVLGSEAGLEVAARHGLAVLLISRGPDGGLTERTTPDFARYRAP